MKPTLVILAAGMASRYGSMKQVQSFGPSGETIMDYSIYDAIRAGFGKVIFIIREEFAESFKENFETKLKGKIQTEYVYQSLNKYTENFIVPVERVKPWGTAHAVLCCKEILKEPFAVINADDFYGANAFESAYDFLVNHCNTNTYGLLGYDLNNTLSDNGSVSRGVCRVDDNNNLIDITERTKIFAKQSSIVYVEDEIEYSLNPSTKVSMNFICYHNNVLDLCYKEFQLFLQKHINDIKSEFYLPYITNQFINQNNGKVKVISTSAKWFGVTYKEDAALVKLSIDKLVANNIYPSNLW